MASKIAETFGEDVMQDGVVDRKTLGRIVFADKISVFSQNSYFHFFSFQFVEWVPCCR